MPQTMTKGIPLAIAAFAPLACIVQNKAAA